MIFKDKKAAKDWIHKTINSLKENGPNIGYACDLKDSRLRNELWTYGLINRSINPVNDAIEYFRLSPKFFEKIEELEEWAIL